VLDEITSGDGGGPAFVLFKIGHEERKPVARPRASLANHGTYTLLPAQRPHGGPNHVPCVQQL
jgi:hypothetical protein